MKRNDHRGRRVPVNPWDRFAARMFGTGDIITNSAGDTLVHDEIVVNVGDIRHEAVTAVMCHAHTRFIERWGSLMNRPTRWNPPVVLMPTGAGKSRYRKV